MDRIHTGRATRVPASCALIVATLLLAGTGPVAADPAVFERGGVVEAVLDYEGDGADLDEASCADFDGGAVVRKSVDVPGGFGTRSWLRTVACRGSWSDGDDVAASASKLDYAETWAGERLKKVVVLARATADAMSNHHRIGPTGRAAYGLTFEPPGEAQVRIVADWIIRERKGTVKAVFDYEVACPGGSVGRTGQARKSSGSWAGWVVLPEPGGACQIDVAARTRLGDPAAAPVRNRIKATLKVTVTLRYCEVVGTDGPDVLVGTAKGQMMCGRGGNDLIRGKGGDDIILGGPGHDRMFGDAGNDRILGGPGDDRALGGRGADTIDGGDDDDTLRGDAGDDVLRAGRGDDLLLGGPGDDLLRGDEGFDELMGEQGADRLHGGKGPDLLCGGEGPDRLYGELGADAAGGGGGRDRVFGGDGYDILAGDVLPTSCSRSGADLADIVNGGAGDDEVVGGAGGDKLTGGTGKDRLVGNSGSDSFGIKDGEKDRVSGGPGRDSLRGGRDPEDVVSGVP